MSNRPSSPSACTVASRASSSSEIDRGSGWRSGRTSGTAISSTTIGTASAQGRTCRLFRYRRSQLRRSAIKEERGPRAEVRVSGVRPLNLDPRPPAPVPFLVHLQELHEVAKEPVAQAGVADVMPFGVLANLPLPVGTQN